MHKFVHSDTILDAQVKETGENKIIIKKELWRGGDGKRRGGGEEGEVGSFVYGRKKCVIISLYKW